VRAECENLYLFIDGQLDDEATARFREHLAACRRCPTALENALVLDAIAEQGLIGGQQLGRTIEVPVVAVPGLTLRPDRRGPRFGLPVLVALAAVLLAAVLAAGWLLLR
jgi:anti-sigma factor RsiW